MWKFKFKLGEEEKNRTDSKVKRDDGERSLLLFGLRENKDERVYKGQSDVGQDEEWERDKGRRSIGIGFLNIEGLSVEKVTEMEFLLKKWKVGVLCLTETHKKEEEVFVTWVGKKKTPPPVFPLGKLVHVAEQEQQQ